MCAQIEITRTLPLIHEDEAITFTKSMFLRFSRSSVIAFSQLEVIYIEIYLFKLGKVFGRAFNSVSSPNFEMPK